ncbi:MAG TPA: 3-isopropylmalate dehydratase small subunit [Burkholderiales bacterium]|nr:3-isopropylmalate dehydratase small subunit [Burkholderiales bacterium]
MKFTTLTAPAVGYEPVNVDTDQILPARFLKMPRGAGYGQFLFHDLGAGKPDLARGAKIFVANRNFGCGSSREGAAFAFYDAGFRSILAPSFGDIFYMNCLKNGIVPVRLPDKVCARLRALPAGAALTVDLEKQEVVAPEGTRHAFQVDAFYREMLLKGVDELGLTLSLESEIGAFERRYAEAFPWASGS